MLVAGDAGGMCLAAGIWLEGVNYRHRVRDGRRPGRRRSHRPRRFSAAGLRPYGERLAASWVLADHKKLRRMPDLIMSNGFQVRYPEIVCSLAEEVFTVRNPQHKPRFGRLSRRLAKDNGVTARNMVQDTWAAHEEPRMTSVDHRQPTTGYDHHDLRTSGRR